MPPTSAPARTPGLATAEAGRDPQLVGRPSGRRPALDGIRAIAVLSVMVYHFGNGAASWLPGGFLGVDIFFVLSGYLITSLLLGEYSRSGGIDLAGFWVRRVKRLFPALLALMLAVCAWIWWASPLESYPLRRQDLWWTLGYLANWHLIHSSDDYFAGFASASPLRHTWSLAVEEQFYLVWPLLVLVLLTAAAKWRARRAAAAVSTGGTARVGRIRGPVVLATFAGAAAVLSAFTMSHEYINGSPSAAYYSTWGRVQELFVGVLLAVALRSPRVRGWLGRRRLTAVAGVAGLGLAVAFLAMSDSAPFYFHGGAMLVSLTAAALVAAVELRPEGAAGRVLSWRPAVLIGQISYGVYLWHWPVMSVIPVFPNYHLWDKVMGQGERVAVTFLIAAVSFRFLEQPVQHSKRLLRSRRRVLGAVVVSMALVAGLTIPATALPGQLGAQLQQRSDHGCSGETETDLVACTSPSTSDSAQNPPEFALLGDSTARAMGFGFDDWAKAHGTTWVQAAFRRCSSTGLLSTGTPTAPAAGEIACGNDASESIRAALAQYRPPTVIIAEFWPAGRAIVKNGKTYQPGTPGHDAVLEQGYLDLVDTIASYGGKAVFLELPPPGDSIGVQLAAGRPAATARQPVSGDGPFNDEFNGVLRKVAAERADVAKTISVTDILCPGGSTCPGVIDGMVVRNDGLHYSLQFSKRVSAAVIQRAGIR